MARQKFWPDHTPPSYLDLPGTGGWLADELMIVGLDMIYDIYNAGFH